jgi:hypothetical protein
LEETLRELKIDPERVLDAAPAPQERDDSPQQLKG